MLKKKCQVVILSAEKSTIETILKCPPIGNIEQYWLKLNKNKEEYPYYVLKPQHLYIVSNEKLKEGDWVTDSELVKQLTGSYGDYPYDLINDSDPIWKIIATTDPKLHIDKIAKIPQSFVEKYILEYNKSNKITEILIEYETYSFDTSMFGGSSEILEFPFANKIKLRSDDTVIIHKVKEAFTKEELPVDSIKNILGFLNTPIGRRKNPELIESLDKLSNWAENNL